MRENKITWDQPPTDKISLDDCEWYHIMEVPGLGLTTDAEFDCREDIGNILGNLDFKNKKVLNLGPITGYLNFEAERRGADVTSIDLGVDPNNLQRDWVVDVKKNWKKDLAAFMERERKRRNAFWYAHKAFKSKSKLIICHVNNLPDEVGLHDIGIIFSVLTHIRDPYTALLRMCSHINEKIVITELGGYNMRSTLFNTVPRLIRTIKEKFSPELPYLRFLPKPSKQGAAWWAFNKEAVIMMLKLLGFEKSTVNYHDYRDNNGKKVFQWTVVAERTVPIDQCDYDYEPN
jgi:O-methyltransferase